MGKRRGARTRHVHGRQPALRRVARVEEHVRDGRGLDHLQHARRVPALDGRVQRAHHPVCMCVWGGGHWGWGWGWVGIGSGMERPLCRRGGVGLDRSAGGEGWDVRTYLWASARMRASSCGCGCGGGGCGPSTALAAAASGAAMACACGLRCGCGCECEVSASVCPIRESAGSGGQQAIAKSRRGAAAVGVHVMLCDRSTHRVRSNPSIQSIIRSIDMLSKCTGDFAAAVEEVG